MRRHYILPSLAVLSMIVGVCHLGRQKVLRRNQSNGYDRMPYGSLSPAEQKFDYYVVAATITHDEENFH